MIGRVRLLVVNAGSSSLKLSVLAGGDELVASRHLEAPRSVVDPDELGAALGEIGAVDAVGHRIVHGGHRFRGAVRVDDGVVAALRDLTELAPLHQPKSLAALGAVGRALPDVPAVACFDTAFHAGLPEPAATYALPRELRERFGLRRFGFHGLSHAHVARRVAELAGQPVSELRTISCHLGAGASLTAIAGGRSVETTMGFTPLEGLVMATRSGSVDPGLMLWLLERGDMDEPELADALEHESGLAGLAGTPRMQDVLAAADRGDEDATLALDVYLHRLRAGIAAMAAALGGVDAIAFTGGVGERAAPVRAGAAAGLGFLGIEIDRERNDAAEGDAEIGAATAEARAFVIEAREDLEIARQVRELLGED